LGRWRPTSYKIQLSSSARLCCSVADPGPVADREDETPMPACEAATAWPKQELASRIGISRNCLAKILDLKCENLSPRISQKIGSAIAALNMHSLGEETQNAILLELRIGVAKAKKKCFSPARWGSAMTSRKLIRASSFYTSNINVLLSYVAIVSRPRYLWGHGKQFSRYRR
jgi:hypothetical protein